MQTIRSTFKEARHSLMKPYNLVPLFFLLLKNAMIYAINKLRILKTTCVICLLALLIITRFSTVCCYADERGIAVDNPFQDPVLIELERQVRRELLQCRFPASLAGSLILSGTVTIDSPRPFSTSREGLSSKYRCKVLSTIKAFDKRSGTILCTATGSFEDIGRTRKTAVKYALGKVISSLCNQISHAMKDDPELFDIEQSFTALKKQEAIIAEHVEVMTESVEDIMNSMERSLGTIRIVHFNVLYPSGIQSGLHVSSAQNKAPQ